jgi:hypothetical protein
MRPFAGWRGEGTQVSCKKKDWGKVVQRSFKYAFLITIINEKREIPE